MTRLAQVKHLTQELLINKEIEFVRFEPFKIDKKSSFSVNKLAFHHLDLKKIGNLYKNKEFNIIV